MARAQCRWRSPDEWAEWSEWLSAGLHARNRWRLGVLLMGILFAHGRRTVTTWLRAAGVRDDFQDYYYCLAALGRKTQSVATQLLGLVLRRLPLPDRLLAVIDDSPTKRYGPKVEGAGIHRNPTPGPADQAYLYGHVWVTLSLALRHPLWGALGLPLRAMLYVRHKTMATLPACRGWRFRTKLVLAAQLVEWVAALVRQAGKTLWVVIDGGYTKRPFLRPVIRAGVVVVGRLRKDAALRDLPANLNLWMHTLVELWAWGRSRRELCDRRDSPWDDARRRPSHANRRKALRQWVIQTELSAITRVRPLPAKIRNLVRGLMGLAA